MGYYEFPPPPRITFSLQPSDENCYETKDLVGDIDKNDAECDELSNVLNCNKNEGVTNDRTC